MRPSAELGGHPVDAAARQDQRHADAAHHERHPEAEGDDQDESEPGPAGGDGPQQDQQGARRRDQAAGQPQDEEAPPGDRRARRQVAVGRAAMTVLAGRAVVVGMIVMRVIVAWMRLGLAVLVRVVVVVLVDVGLGGARGASAPDLGQEHPSADGHDRDGGDHRGPADDRIRGKDVLGSDDEAGEHQDADGVRHRDRQAKPDGVEDRAAGADE